MVCRVHAAQQQVDANPASNSDQINALGQSLSSELAHVLSIVRTVFHCFTLVKFAPTPYNP
jgi:hypothetical protein